PAGHMRGPKRERSRGGHPAHPHARRPGRCDSRRQHKKSPPPAATTAISSTVAPPLIQKLSQLTLRDGALTQDSNLIGHAHVDDGGGDVARADATIDDQADALP